MISLIVGLLFGIIVAVFATRNTAGVTVDLLTTSWANIPLYAVVVGSILLGVVISWILSLPDFISASFALSRKDKAITNAKKTITDLKTKIHELEVENVQLRNGTVIEEPDTPPEHEYVNHHQHTPQFLRNLRQRFSQ